MSIYQVRLLNGSYNVVNLEFTLIIECIKGKPEPGDGIMLLGCVWTIKGVKRSLTGKNYEIIANTDIRFLNDFNKVINYLKGKKLVCGFSMQEYRLLPSNEKLHYFKELAYLYPFKQVWKFLREHIQLRLALFPIKNAPTTGLSKIGGLPNAPEFFQYPKDLEGRSTLFIGQIHIGEFNQRFESTKQLKGKGILYFFGTIKISHASYHSFDNIFVRYSEQTSDLVEIPLPDDILEYGVFDEMDIMVVEEISLPPDESTLIDEAALTEEEILFYEEFQEFVDSYNYLEVPNGSYFDSIKFLGYPQQLHGCILIETVFKNLRQGWYNPDEKQRLKTPEMKNKAMAEALKWRHLFSFPTKSFRKMSNFNGEFNQYMDGIFNVMVKQADIDKMDFDHTESVYQST